MLNRKRCKKKHLEKVPGKGYWEKLVEEYEKRASKTELALNKVRPGASAAESFGSEFPKAEIFELRTFHNLFVVTDI